MSNWTIGPVPIATAKTRYVTPGWVSDKFGIDCRYDDEGDWALVVTHLKTGHVVTALVESLEKAKQFADRISALGDWDFTDPSECKAYGAGVKVAREGLVRVQPGDLIFSGALEMVP